MNHLAAIWRNSGFRWLCSVISGLGAMSLVAIAGAPAAVAATLAALPPTYCVVKERVVLSPMWRRLFRTGRGAAGDWMSPIELRRHTHPLPKRLE